MHTDDPLQILDAQQKLLEEQMPEITSAVGAHAMKTLRQTTCTGQYDPATMGASVQWSVDITRSVPGIEAAKAAATPARRVLEEHGWAVEGGPGKYPGPITTIFTADHAATGLHLIAEHRSGGNESLLVLHGGGSCVDTPDGYQMVRSHLDRGFGSPQAEYDSEAERRSPQYEEPTLAPGEQPGPASPDASQAPGPASSDR